MANSAPQVTTFDREVVDDEQLAISSLVRFSDEDGDDIQLYLVRLADVPAGGYLYLGNQRLGAQKTYRLTAEQWSQLTFRGDLRQNRTVSSMIMSRAYDGTAWSSWGRSTVTTLINANRPRILADYQYKIQTDRRDRATDMFTVFDEDGSSAKLFQFSDHSAGRGYFLFNGRERTGTFRVRAEHLHLVEFNAASRSARDTVTIKAFDGRYWSPEKVVRVDTLIRPVIAGTNGGVFVLEDQERITLRNLFYKASAGPAFNRYQIYDANGNDLSGLIVRGRIGYAAGRVYDLSVQDFNSLSFEGGKFDVRSIDELFIRAHNGHDWTRWTSVELNTEPNMIGSLATTSWLEFNETRNPLTITYSFMNALPSWYDGETEATEYRPLTNQLRAAAREALQNYEDVLNIDMMEVPPEEYGTISFGMADLDDEVLAWAYLPNAPEPQTAANPGDVWYNWYDYAGYWLGAGSKGPGSAAYETTLHEIGHAMGLKHPFEGTPRLSSSTDNSGYTVMSYTGYSGGLPASTLMVYDIAALQDLYGANMSYEAGDTTWQFRADGQVLETIWDAGGRDTIDMTNQGFRVQIDLRQGQYSSVGLNPFTLTGYVDNLGIAYGAEIENAMGTVFNDVLVGNELRNALRGNNGNDLLRGRQGNDWLVGGGGNDTYEYHVGDGDDYIFDQVGGVDTLQLHWFDRIRFSSLTFWREGNDLYVDLSVHNESSSEGTIRLHDNGGASQIETLELYENGSMIGSRVDLTSVFAQTTGAGTQFGLTSNSSAFVGWLRSSKAVRLPNAI